MTWKNDYLVGIDAIDDQHKKIIGMINELHESLTTEASMQELNELLARLTVYTVKHFIFEEKIFKQYGYPFEEEHKKEHDVLSQQVVDFQKKHIVEGQKVGEDLLVFYKALVSDHILSYDKMYVPFISDHGLH